MRSTRSTARATVVVHLPLVADVAGQVPRAPAIGLDRRDGALEVGLVAPQHEHVGALACERTGGGLADAAATARDDHVAAVEAVAQSCVPSAISEKWWGVFAVPVLRMPTHVNTTAASTSAKHAVVIDVWYLKLVASNRNVLRKFL